MDTKEVTNVLFSDQEIAAKLKERTTPELRAFQKKLKTMPQTPQSWAIRFHLIRELLLRSLFMGEEIENHEEGM